MLHHRIIQTALFVVILLSFAGGVEAATITVTANAPDVLNGADASCSLREAITNINDAAATYADCGNSGAAYGTSDTINIPAGAYTIAIANIGGVHENLNATGDFDIRRSVAITGAGSGSTIIDGANLDNVFHVTGAYTVSISNVTIRNADGGIYNLAGATLTVSSSTISGNTAVTSPGAGIYNAGTLNVINSTISGNSATWMHGGAIYNNVGTVNVTNSTLSGNSGGFGGAIYNGGGAITITGSTISGNSAQSGGGIYSNGGATATISGSTISGNSATVNDGGGIHTSGASSITNSTLSGNSAVGGGGAIYNAGSATISDSTLRSNSANTGAGIYNFGGGATATISTSTVSGNTAGAQGGGIRNAGTITLTNSTISGNQSTASDGGGVYTTAGTATFANCTITNNDAATNTDGVYRTGGNLSFTNTIIAGNGGGDDCTGSYAGASNGNNLDSDNTCFLNQASDLPGSALASLGALASNGGSTQTHALQAGSAAIDAGSCVQGADQRGTSRPQGTGCDIGAYEANWYTVNVTASGSGSVADTNTVTGFDIACPGTCSDSASAGTSVTLTATASSGYIFSGWSGNCSGTSTTCTLTVSAAKNVTATFTSIAAGATAGCTDSHATNYNSAATVDDGSCIYPNPDFGATGSNSFDFGTGKVGATVQKTLTLKNTGPISTYVHRLEISGSPFSIVSDSCSGAAILQNNSCDVIIAFASSSAGTFSGTLNIWTNSPKYNPLSVSLTGKATNSTVTPAALISPENGATLSGTKATFEWSPGGDATGAKTTDSAYICEREDFSGCETPALTSSRAAIPAGVILLLGLIAPIGLRNRRARAVLIALIFITSGAAGLWACGSSDSGQSSKTVTLKAETKYYWKVVTSSANGTEASETRSFITGK